MRARCETSHSFSFLPSGLSKDNLGFYMYDNLSVIGTQSLISWSDDALGKLWSMDLRVDGSRPPVGDLFLQLNPIRPGLFSLSPGPEEGEGGGGSEAQMPKIKVNINQLKWNFAWVIIPIRAFLMQTVRLIAYLILEIWHHKISLVRGEGVIRFSYLLPENRFNF